MSHKLTWYLCSLFSDHCMIIPARMSDNRFRFDLTISSRIWVTFNKAIQSFYDFYALQSFESELQRLSELGLGMCFLHRSHQCSSKCHFWWLLSEFCSSHGTSRRKTIYNIHSRNSLRRTCVIHVEVVEAQQQTACFLLTISTTFNLLATYGGFLKYGYP